MSSVTQRIKEIKQPAGGFLNPVQFSIVRFEDDTILFPDENIHPTLIGLAVDYLSRFIVEKDAAKAFEIPIMGALNAQRLGVRNATDAAIGLLGNIQSLDEKSVISACKMAAFDAWYRSPFDAMRAKRPDDINPSEETIYNIQTMCFRFLSLTEHYGPVKEFGFTFAPPGKTLEQTAAHFVLHDSAYGGYTKTVQTGDGDFITEDTLWDMKVLRNKPNSKHTLQLLMYWLMGLHSGQECYQSLQNLGIFNPRLNTAYILSTSKIPQTTIDTVENEVICY